MSSFTITIVVPHAENESLFLRRVVQAALQAYRKNHSGSDRVDAKHGEVMRDESGDESGVRHALMAKE